MPEILISGKYPTIDESGHIVSPNDPHKLPTDESPSECCPFHTDHAIDQLKRRNLARDQGREVYSVTREDESMREALKQFRAVRDDYRTADYGKSFNWAEIATEYKRQLSNFDHLPSRETEDVPIDWFAVAFRSKRRTDCDNVDLFDADRKAYEEAFYGTNKSLLMYWYSDLDDEQNCLATCIWTSRDIARSVNSLPHHHEAARLSAGSYVHYNVGRCRIQWVDDTFRVSSW
ncbi:hypothetical protein IW140_004208 [Coemansia sp. RSA 1813]|nr:hypothetical protein EV178_004310 [Coemansia sp. RSA 1646]KAJ1767059.1 hypothetical protein LPJ74_005564 [Coemansia sp. RSA 1843]KAJ2088061.1 hypothetical protein IW138_004481 [Coemansia sp. RSA 986]KAJ2210775.1 hypothetical protein EV179_006007 [Coemansia sp. RSA 487]KAJ2568037.1 hypothetical protein IW140_004208 [Coemansia sp. RSA 1813]